jgi:hypothetical protein
MPSETKRTKNAALVGSIGLYATCYELAKRGWNVMPTSRNARGIDILGYDQRAKERITVQVKTLSKSSPVPLGLDKELCNLMLADFVVIVTNARTMPQFYIARTPQVKENFHVGIKNGKESCWLWPSQYVGFKDRWDTIGEGW